MSKAGKVAGATAAGAGGGAAAGTAIMPGIGTAVGGFLGAAGGFLGSMFGDDDEGPREIASPDIQKWKDWGEFGVGADLDEFRAADGRITAAPGGGRMGRFEAPYQFRQEAERAFETPNAYSGDIHRARGYAYQARRAEQEARNRSLQSRGLGQMAIGQSQQARGFDLQGRQQYQQGMDTLQQRAQGQDLMAHRAAQMERERNQAAMASMAASTGGYNPAAARAAMMQGSQLQSQSAGATAYAAQAEQRAYQDAYMKAVDQQRQRDQGLRDRDLATADTTFKQRQLDQYGRSQEQAMRRTDQAQQALEQQWWQQQNQQNWAKDAAKFKWLQQGYDERQRRAANRLQLAGIGSGVSVAGANLAHQASQAAANRQDQWLMGGLNALGGAAQMYGQYANQGAGAPPQLSAYKAPEDQGYDEVNKLIGG